jgi:hypothetical protein
MEPIALRAIMDEMGNAIEEAVEQIKAAGNESSSAPPPTDSSRPHSPKDVSTLTSILSQNADSNVRNLKLRSLKPSRQPSNKPPTSPSSPISNLAPDPRPPTSSTPPSTTRSAKCAHVSPDRTRAECRQWCAQSGYLPFAPTVWASASRRTDQHSWVLRLSPAAWGRQYRQGRGDYGHIRPKADSRRRAACALGVQPGATGVGA